MIESHGRRLDEEAEDMVFGGLCSDIYLLCDLDFGKRRGIGKALGREWAQYLLQKDMRLKAFEN